MTDAAIAIRAPLSKSAAYDLPSEQVAGAIVPADTMAGHALAAVIAIMTFLASLTIGALVLVDGATSEWQTAVSREMTIQVRPTPGRDVEAEVAKAVEIARATRGVADVVAFSKQESGRLLEPWLGSGLSLDELPVPRMIVVRVGSTSPDVARLRNEIAEQVIGASLDDHRGWIDRMRAAARTIVALGLAVLALVLAATMLSVAFATRGAMASNRGIVEVLHFVGARDRFIAREFQRNFLMLGLKGGAMGGGLAMGIFGLANLYSYWFQGPAEHDQIGLFFGSLSLGTAAYVAVIVQVILVAVVTAATSRLIVHRTLRSIE